LSESTARSTGCIALKLTGTLARRGKGKLIDLFHDSDFIAIREFDTLQAVRPDFMREHRFIHFLETQFLKKIRLIGQGKDPLHPKFF
jgi:hypothetical protein